MFRFFEGLRKKEQENLRLERLASLSKCRICYREPQNEGPGIYVEIHSEDEHLAYVSNRGVTPAYLNVPYDQWCRENLLESYVFATLDSALDYFQRRQGGIKPDLLSAIRRQTAA